MHTNQNPFAQYHQAGIESLADLAHAQFRAAERLSSLSFDFARSMFSDSATYAKALLVTKETPELSRLSTALALPALDRTIAYTLGVCELGVQTQGEMTRLADAHASGFSKSMGRQLEKIAQSAPAGADVPVLALKSVLDSASSTLDSLRQVGLKTRELAQTKFDAVNSDIADADMTSGTARRMTGKGSARNSQAGKSIKRKSG